MFEGRQLLIATRHNKESVISPRFANEWGVVTTVAKRLNTDRFGSFCGTFDRIEDPITVAKQKCLAGMDLYGLDLAIASEGSFGPHPELFFAPLAEECLVLVDKKNAIEIAVRHVSMSTNFAAEVCEEWDEVLKFAEKIGFPDHGIVMRVEYANVREIQKGIQDYDELELQFKRFKKKTSKVFLETDMRAHMNPTRMKEIGLAAEKLIQRLKRCCPDCSAPGFGDQEAIGGLPCSECGFPTSSIFKVRVSCSSCGFSVVEAAAHGRSQEDPMYCQNCNP
jgi:hypothetical protein